MNYSGTKLILALTAVALILSGSASAEETSFSDVAVNGGGGTSTNAEFRVTGTIGQASMRLTMKCGDYRLAGGFGSVITAIQTPGAPRLTIAVTSTNTVILSWPASATGYILQETSQATMGNWSDLSLPTTDDGKTLSAVLTTTGGNRFFRLRKP